MAKKTFISYKYSEAQPLRDDILEAMGDDATYYTGETSESRDLTDTSTENIRNNLTEKMHGTSVTIVIISPNIKDSVWIDWEISYSLKEITREDRTSRTNGIVGVIMKINNDYSWLIGSTKYTDGCTSRTIDTNKLYKIINENRFNQSPKVYSCDQCKTVDSLSGSYISLVKEDDFLNNPSKYIDNAYDKSSNISSYEIVKEV